MQNVLAVFLGGGAGAVLRYLTGVLALRYLSVNLPAATFAVNIAGCFILTLPIFLLFLVANKFFMQNLGIGGLKG